MKISKFIFSKYIFFIINLCFLFVFWCPMHPLSHTTKIIYFRKFKMISTTSSQDISSKACTFQPITTVYNKLQLTCFKVVFYYSPIPTYLQFTQILSQTIRQLYLFSLIKIRGQYYQDIYSISHSNWSLALPISCTKRCYQILTHIKTILIFRFRSVWI